MIPLSVSTMEQVFNTIRRQSIGGAQSFVKIAFVLGCIFVTIRLVKLVYDIISDEQHGGLGGVRLWDVLKPVVFLALIQGSVLFVTALDYTTTAVVSSVSNSVVIANADATFKEQMKRITDEYDETVEKETDQTLEDESEGGMMARLWTKITNAMKELWMEIKKGFLGATTTVSGLWIPWLAVKFYDFLTMCFQVVANIFLCLLALLFPITVCLNILDIWRQNLSGFIVKYVQVSFWKVILTAMQWIVANARIGAVKVASAILGTGASSADILSTSEAACWTTAVICIAACMCIGKIPEWASTVIGGGGEATGGAGSVATGLAEGATTPVTAGTKAVMSSFK